MPRDTKVLTTKRRLCAFSCIYPYTGLPDRPHAYITPYHVVPRVQPHGTGPNIDFIVPMRPQKIVRTVQHKKSHLSRNTHKRTIPPVDIHVQHEKTNYNNNLRSPPLLFRAAEHMPSTLPHTLPQPPQQIRIPPVPPSPHQT